VVVCTGVVEDADALAGQSSWTARWLYAGFGARPTTWALVDVGGNAIDVASSPALERHVKTDTFASRFEAVPPDDADWWVVKDGECFRLRAHPGLGGNDRFLTGAHDVGPHLEAAARWANLARLTNSSTAVPLPDGLSIEMRVRAGGRDDEALDDEALDDQASDDRGRGEVGNGEASRVEDEGRRPMYGGRIVPGDQIQVRARVAEGQMVDHFLYHADGLWRLLKL